MSRPRGRPTEQASAVTRTLHIRLTEAEHVALAALAAQQGVTISRLLRRAVREMITHAPDPFDDGIEQLARLATVLAASERTLRTTGADPAATTELHTTIEGLRLAVASLVQASRTRWVPVLESELSLARMSDRARPARRRTGTSPDDAA